MSGPLAGLRVVEFAGLGPVPMAAMLLSDLGAEVISIDRLEPSGLGIPRAPRFDVYRRGRRSLALDLKHSEGVAVALELVGKADALIEGFRPGTMERLGLGPEPCLARNPRLVYGRVTGWGQSGPLAQAAGHDLNYIALTGALAAIGPAGGAPTVPLNLIGDYGGGAMLLALGVLAALIEAKGSGKGQVVDAAMSEGAATLLAPFFGLLAAGIHREERGSNLLDGGAPFYAVYRCADGEYVSVAAIEAKFRKVLVERMGFAPGEMPDMDDRANWDRARTLLAARFAGRTRAEWCAVLEGSDACFAPVLAMSEAATHPQAVARGAFVSIAGVEQPAPAPRFSRSVPGMPAPADAPGASSAEVLASWGFDAARIARLAHEGIIPAGASFASDQDGGMASA